ncbi:hypothetical protein MOV08_37555 [Streptomyces yunnanensis]|uniref:DUF6801 domain-containing protein n=1 Tax=Streptomyces yunnanensis TaxID=156453 RepID=A0ABY8AJR3_9ACTN|nr:DUF6801 domain-containing protein [Streptomyces yunnanensis]WEB44444.1 hypothetical protein MOV08_37555 [Streptomyces yunnanensis]
MISTEGRQHRCGSARAVLRGLVARRVVTVATTVGVAVGIVGLTGAGPAAADPLSRTLAYACSVQSFTQTARVRIDADVPTSTAVGQPTPRFVIRAGAPLGSALTSGLNWLGVKSIEGRADAQVRVVAPHGGGTTTVPFQMPRTAVPDSGSLAVRATGTAPSRTFDRPGRAQITVGDLVLHVVPRDADGKVFRGPIDVPCTLAPQQNNVVASFAITANPPAGSTTTGNNGSAGSGAAGPGSAAHTGPSAADGTPGSTASGAPGEAGGAAGPNSRDGKPSGARHPEGGERRGTSGLGATVPSGSTTAIGSQHTRSLVLLAVGAFAVGALALALALRFRARRK